MATIYWKSGQTGSWETAADWSTGAVPGAGDTAIISAAGSYSVDVTAPVTVGALTLNATAALNLSSSLSVGSLTLDRGHLTMLNGSSLSGQVTDVGPPVVLEGDATWNDVTWHGDLLAGRLGAGTLTLANGFSLTGLDGSSPGTATTSDSVVLENTPTLNNATISIVAQLNQTSPVYLGSLSVQGTSALTLGSGLTLAANVFANDLTNDGVLQGNVTAAGTYTNNGQQTFVNPPYTVQYPEPFIRAASFTNNGTMIVSGELDIFGKTLSGGLHSSIELSGFLVLSGNYTTVEFEHLIASQHVEGSGDFGISLLGTLNNAGAILSIGSGTALGDLGQVYDVTAQIDGGVVAMHGTTTQLYANVANATINAHTTVLDVGNNSFVGDTLNHVRVLDVYDPNLANDPPVTFALNGDSFTAGPATIDVAMNNTLVLGGEQATAGLLIDLSDYSTLNAQADGQLECNIHVNGRVQLGSLSLGSSGALSVAVNSSAFADISATAGRVMIAGFFDDTGAVLNSGTIAIGASGQANFDGGQNNGSIILASGGDLDTLGIDTGNATTFTNDGTISMEAGSLLNAYEAGSGNSLINAGDISIGKGALLFADQINNSGTINVDGGLLEINPSAFTNTGSITFENGGHLLLDGALTLQSLAQFASFGAAEVIAGSLTLSSNETLDLNGSTPGLSLGGGLIGGGNVVIEAGQTFQAVGGIIDSSLTNDGTLVVAGDAATSIDAPGVDLDAVAGTGVIALSNTGAGLFALNLLSSVSAGQTIDFAVGKAEISLDTFSQEHFRGTIEGFGAGDQVALKGNVTSASFQGDSLTATLSNGSTIALATTSALTGSLSVHYFTGSNQSVLTYEPVGAAINDIPSPVSPEAGASSSHVSETPLSWLDTHAHDLGWTPTWHGHAV